MKKKFFITTTIAPSLFFFKGQPRLWKEYFDVLAIANQKDRLTEFANEEGINSLLIPMKREISPISDLICLLKFLWLFIKERPFIVHGNTPKASMLSMFAAWLTRRPVRIYMCHGLRYQTTTGLTRKLLMAFEWLSCSCATSVICVSNGVKDQLVKDHLCKSSKGRIVHYGTAGGIDTTFFSRESLSVEDRLGIPEDAFVFSFVGRVVRDKGVNELVKATDRLCKEGYNVYLLLIGSMEQSSDPIAESSLEIIRNNEHIMALGRQQDVRPYLMCSDAFVLPSYREGVGQVLLEACSMGVPCIASNIIGCNEVIIPGVNGDLVSPHDEEALYVKMKEWLMNPSLVKTIANTCRDSITERFNRDDVCQAYLQVYKSYLNE